MRIKARRSYRRDANQVQLPFFMAFTDLHALHVTPSTLRPAR
jgi:hypothetical protein